MVTHRRTHIVFHIYSYSKAPKLYGTCQERTGGKFRPGHIVNQVTVTIERVDTKFEDGYGYGDGSPGGSGNGSATPNGMRS